jgi:hypothetical protein
VPLAAAPEVLSAVLSAVVCDALSTGALLSGRALPLAVAREVGTSELLDVDESDDALSP